MHNAHDHADGTGWSGQSACDEWVGGSADAKRIRGEIATASLTGDPVVIVGEAGTGRRLAAKLIHASNQNGRPDRFGSFLPVEAGTVPALGLSPYVEALAARTPETKNGSGPRTLYLSGIARAGLADFGALAATPGIRLIASTAPVATTPANGRRKAFPGADVPGLTAIRIPPLRERKMDISSLALRFLTDACERTGVGPYGISTRMIAAYHDYDWPGNAAELKAIIESAVSTAALARFRGKVFPDSFCAIDFNGDRTGRSLKEMLRDVERNILEQTLHRVDGNQTHAARILQLNTTTLHEKLKRHNLLRSTRTEPNTGKG